MIETTIRMTNGLTTPWMCSSSVTKMSQATSTRKSILLAQAGIIINGKNSLEALI